MKIRLTKLEDYYTDKRYTPKLVRCIAYSMVYDYPCRPYYKWLSGICKLDMSNVALYPLKPRVSKLSDYLLIDFSILLTKPLLMSEKLRTELYTLLISGDIK